MPAPKGQGFDLAALRGRVGDAFTERVAWLLTAAATGGAGLSVAEMREALGAAHPSIEGFRRMIRHWRGRLGVHEAVEIVEASDERVELTLRDERGRRWRLAVRLEVEPPRRIALFAFSRELPPSVRIREASAVDEAALEAIERASPITQADGTRVTIVRGRAYFDQMRLMERCLAYVAEDDGRPIGFDALALHDARMLGQRVRVAYRHHTRVSADHQRIGLNEALIAYRQERICREPAVQVFYVYVDPSNEVIRGWSPTPPWSLRPFRAHLRCDAVAVPTVGRPAVEGDLAAAAAWMNTLHGPAEMFLPYDVVRLRQRLARNPTQYGFPQIRLTDGAVVGVWDAQEHIVRESAAGASESLRAWVLDYGIASPSALGALEQLLRSWCGELAARGVTHLSLFCHDASPAAPLVRDLAETIAPVEFQSSVPEPADLAARGLYVDPIYW